VLLGLGRTEDTWSFSSLEFVLGAKTLIGSMYGSGDARVDFPRMLDLRARGELDLASLVTRRIGLAEINDAFTDIARGSGLRTVVEMP
jgi:S-(hydroxymethyl)glutathione dehydrogenase/alcohol dehydrogenase